MSRRKFLAAGAGAAALAACGSTASKTSSTSETAPPTTSAGTTATTAASTAATTSATTAESTAASTVTRKMGGTLRVGSLGSEKDSIDAHFSSTDMDQQRNQNLYDSLSVLQGTLPYHTDFALAESIEMNADATEATVRLRSGVEFHHGKTLAAEDLVFTVQRILNPDKFGRARSALAAVDPAALEIIDPLTVKFTLKTPDSMFPQRWTSAATSILPTDFDPEKPVGTGAFMVKSFTPGSRSVFVKNPNYWRDGEGPYLDEVQIIDFADDTSRTAALLSGQIDALDGVDPALLDQVESAGLSHMITKSGFYQPITMRVDLAPFNDVRVRQAFRLMVDREAMVKQAYSGFAQIANDMPCPADPGYPSDLPQRVQDIDQAKSLLKAAGQEGMTVTLTTAPENGNLVNSAQVFAQQCAAAGVTVKVDVLTPTEYDAKFKEWPFTNGYWAAGIIGTGYSGRFLPDGGGNDSKWNDPDGQAIYADMLKTTDEAKRNELGTELLTRFYDTGPDIVHTFKYNIDAFSPKLVGFEPFDSNGWSLGAWRYRNISFA